jgi:hypothetical protein
VGVNVTSFVLPSFGVDEAARIEAFHADSTSGSVPALRAGESLTEATDGKIVLAYYGAGPTDGYGNIWLKAIVARAQPNAYLYPENRGMTGLKAVFTKLDSDGDYDIEPGEIQNIRIRMLGYSWGAMEAVSVANSLNYPGWEEHRPYTTQSPIRVQYLFAIDPIAIGKTNTHASGNVDFVETVYQRSPSYSGGKSWMRVSTPAGASATFDMWNSLSRRLSGKVITSQNGHGDAWHLLRDDASTGKYTPQGKDGADWNAQLVNFGWINHDTIPWVVYWAHWDASFRIWW